MARRRYREDVDTDYDSTHMVKTRACLGTGILVIALASGAVIVEPGPTPTPRSITYPTRTMGTYANITLVGADSVLNVPHAVAAQQVFAHVDSLMSNWTTTSEVARINREAATTTVTVHPEVARVLEMGLEVGRNSRECFDMTVEPLVRAWGFLGGSPRIPPDSTIEAALPHVGSSNLDFNPDTRALRFKTKGTRVDLGGIAKGYGVDEAARVLRARGVENALLNISGNMAALGSPAGKDAWSIGIRDPRDRMPYVATISITDRAIATSGTYEQFVAGDGQTYGHIIDPRTGRPSEGLLSVTVVAKTATEADAWGTAFFVLGAREAREIAKERDDLAVALIQPGASVDTLWVEEQLKDRFHIVAGTDQILYLRYF